MPVPNADSLFWQQTINRIFNGSGKRIVVPATYRGRMEEIYKLFDNDYTGIVSTIIDFMVGTGTVPMNFITDNENLTKSLNDWSIHKLNKDINLDIPKGLKALTTQYMRERFRSSFICLNIVWEKIDGLVLPSKMWFADGASIIVEPDEEGRLDKKKYFLGDKDNEIKMVTKNSNTIIRKPYNAWYDDYPTPYLVKRGVLFNAMYKKSLINQQASVIEEMIPYLLMIRAGDANLVAKNAMGDIEAQLTKVKDSLKKAKNDRTANTGYPGDMILKGRYDLQLDQFIPDLTKLLNTTIVEPVNYDLLAGLGLIELQGFSSSRQETILNPKVLVEEINTAIMDFKALMEEVTDLIIEKNASLHPKHMNKDIRVVPGVAKAFLTDNMRKLIKDYTNTGLISIEDAFEGLPQGFDFEISKKRRQNEADNGYEDLFFPRVILNQDSNAVNDVAPRTPTPNEVPQKKEPPIQEEPPVVTPEEAALDPVETDGYIRFRQREPNDFKKGSFRTITLSEKKGIKAVIGVLKGKTTTVIQSYIFDKDKFTVDEAKTWLQDHNAEELTGKIENLEAPYLKVSQLPKLVRSELPVRAQHIWMAVFNDIYKRSGGNEVRAIRGAWSAVKRLYHKSKSGKWVKNKKSKANEESNNE
jgi:cation transport regulator ChaB